MKAQFEYYSTINHDLQKQLSINSHSRVADKRIHRRYTAANLSSGQTIDRTTDSDKVI